MDLVKWCADQPLVDLTVGKPDLDSLFRKFYSDDGESP